MSCTVKVCSNTAVFSTASKTSTRRYLGNQHQEAAGGVFCIAGTALFFAPSVAYNISLSCIKFVTLEVDLSRTDTTNEMLEIFAARLFCLRTINLASCRQVRFLLVLE